MFLNDIWASNGSVKSILSNKDVEIMTVNVRPYYLPREFSTVQIVLVYCPPNGNSDSATEYIFKTVNNLSSEKTDAVKLVMVDFNHIKLEAYLPLMHQYVNKPTRELNCLDKCFRNVKNAYICKMHTELGKSDHNMVELEPLYVKALERVEVKCITFKKYIPGG